MSTKRQKNTGTVWQKKFNKWLQKKKKFWWVPAAVIIIVFIVASFSSRSDEQSSQHAYINPKILENRSHNIMPGLPQEYYLPDHIELTFQDNTWHESSENDSFPSDSDSDEQIKSRLAKIRSLRIGEKTQAGTRAIENVIESTDKNVFIVQLGIEKFLEPDEGYYGGHPFTQAEDYECNLAISVCNLTDILKKADTHMAANGIATGISGTHSFWYFWNREAGNIVGYYSRVAAPTDAIYMYYPSRDEHIKTDNPDIYGLEFSPSRKRLLLLHDNYKITSYELGDHFTPLKKADYSNLRELFDGSSKDYAQPLHQANVIWSVDESTVYFIQPQRVFSYNFATGVTERLIDATPLFNLPGVNPFNIQLSKSGRYLYYLNSPYPQSDSREYVIIDLITGEKKELIADAPR